MKLIMLKHWFIAILLAVNAPITLSNESKPATIISVGAYEFPPFFETSNGTYGGLTPLLLDAFNEIQNDYVFKLTLTSPKRRYIDFERGRIQMLFFEDPKWGWNGYPVVTSEAFLKGGEVFIARNNKTTNKTAFKNIEQRRITAMLGYHYQFADWDSDAKRLKERFNISLLSHSGAIIKQVVRGKAEIGIVSKAFLDRELFRDPKLKKVLVFSDFYDQHYSHRVILASDANISIETINSILKKLHKNGKLTEIFSQFGLSPSPL
ncbi:periplasmic binding protein [Oceanobacter sp. RED65]|uniref:Periplasmic binding protein n=2 Tax=Bermanella marisrubri TaxID=207949 RepID=Q1N6L7_9GAMM|nr:periplasmic binding protein [Oceanobacter sp. RED65] [Bermanella marisrubri]